MIFLNISPNIYPKIQKNLLIDLSQFLDNIYDSLYGFVGQCENVVYQGDGIVDLPIIKLPDNKIANKPSIIISNTCDIGGALNCDW